MGSPCRLVKVVKVEWNGGMVKLRLSPISMAAAAAAAALRCAAVVVGEGGVMVWDWAPSLVLTDEGCSAGEV